MNASLLFFSLRAQTSTEAGYQCSKTTGKKGNTSGPHLEVEGDLDGVGGKRRRQLDAAVISLVLAWADADDADVDDLGVDLDSYSYSCFIKEDENSKGRPFRQSDGFPILTSDCLVEKV